MTTSEFMAFATAGGALLAAFSAWQSARATRLAAEGQLLALMLGAYADPSMLYSLRCLRQWREDYGDQFAVSYRQMLDSNNPIFHDIDRSRRQVSHFFQNALALHRTGCVGKKFFREVTLLHGIEIFFQIVEPLEHALNAGYRSEIFREIERLSGRRHAVFLIRAVPPEHNVDHR